MNNRRIVIIIAIASSFLSPVCTSGNLYEPTPNINLIKTEAIQTAVANLTVQAILFPTDTPQPPVATPKSDIAQINDATRTASDISTLPSSSNRGSTNAADENNSAAQTTDVLLCELIARDPTNGPQKTGEVYEMKWTIQNTGDAGWKRSDFYVKWTGGDDISPRHIYKLKHDVGHNDTIDIIIEIEVPTQVKDPPGYMTDWAIVNDKGKVFCRFNHHVTMAY